MFVNCIRNIHLYFLTKQKLLNWNVRVINRLKKQYIPCIVSWYVYSNNSTDIMHLFLRVHAINTLQYGHHSSASTNIISNKYETYLYCVSVSQLSINDWITNHLTMHAIFCFFLLLIHTQSCQRHRAWQACVMEHTFTVYSNCHPIHFKNYLIYLQKIPLTVTSNSCITITFMPSHLLSPPDCVSQTIFYKLLYTS